MIANKEELYRRLAQSRRLADEPIDVLTRNRLNALRLEIEEQIATVEARDANATLE
jgi:hypothetical protein